MNKIAYFVFLLLISAYFGTSVYHPDVFFYLVEGNWVRANQTCPPSDLWTVVGQKESWFSVSCLFSLVLSYLDEWFSWKGLYLLKLFIIMVFVLGASLVFSKISGSKVRANLLVAFVSVAFLLDVGLGPKLFAAPLIVAFLYFVSKTIEKPFVKELVWLYPLSLISIGSFSKLINIYDYRVAVFLVLAFTLCLFRFSKNDFFSRHWRLNISSLILVVLAILDASLIGFVSLWLGFVLSYDFSKSQSMSSVKLLEGLSLLEAKLEKSTVKSGAIVLMLSVCIVRIAQGYALPYDHRGFPQKAVDFIIESEAAEPVLTNSVFGAYLIYRFSNHRGEPGKQVVLDSRLEEISPELYSRFTKAQDSGIGLADLLDGLGAKTVLCVSQTPFCEVFSDLEDWGLKYTNGKPVNDQSEQLVGWTVFAR